MSAELDAFITSLRSATGEPAKLVDQLDDLNGVGPANHTPLGAASFHGRADLSRCLLERGADVNRVYANGRSPLFGAVGRKDLEMMRLLVEHGADVNLGIPAIRHTPLHRAAYVGLLPLVQFLLAHGAHVNAQTLARNPDFDVPDEAGGETPLHYAAGFAGGDVIACLLDNGAEAAIKNRQARAPIDWA